ncbi:MAG TPA: NAD(P)H-hydrate dehydratase [Terriglobales bacterium]|nr:NAD(P)H-hydrate dehydratase [Terriglobales bacterium]
MKIVTAAEMREIDRATSERFGVASSTLMENAGAAVADVALARWPEARRVVVVCGKGNNGGDGFVAARKLSQAGKQVGVALLAAASELKGDAAQMFEQLPMESTELTSGGELREAVEEGLFDCDLIVDALLGTGVKPPVTGLYAEAITAMNAAKAPVLAVDIPSGADSDATGKPSGAVARANAVVTFTAPKPAHLFARLTDGPTFVAPIGSPAEAIESKLGLNLITAADFAGLLAPRRADAHKGDFGHVLVLGGSAGKAGAAAMAGMGALRAGAGLVTVATPRSVQKLAASFAPELMTEGLEETEAGGVSLKAMEYGRMEKLCAGKSVLAIGPGLGQDAETVEFVRALVKQAKQPVVLDADGLNAFAGTAQLLDGSRRPLVLTPHPGEFARLTGKDMAAIAADPVGLALSFAKEHRCTLVLKGHRTIVATPEHGVWVNATGNPGMAKGGSGDVLTGMIAGISSGAKQCSGETAGAAVYLHGLAGDLARAADSEPSMVATDILGEIGDAFRVAAETVHHETVVINP